MPKTDIPRSKQFEQLVEKRFHIYNSLFLNLPYDRASLTGEMLPVLGRLAEKRLKEGHSPQAIMLEFFEKVAEALSEVEQIDLLFRIVQYVERQVVLFDSVEDAAFPQLKDGGKHLSVDDFFELSDSRKNWDQVKEFLNGFGVRIVLTAHPTQFYPLAVLNTIKKMERAVSEERMSDVDNYIQQLGLTSLLNEEKPSPVQEARNIIYFLREVYYDAIGELYSDIKRAVNDRDFDNHHLLTLGFWPGGDRDGNPFVTAETTWTVSQDLRMSLMKCYYNEVKQLRQCLTFREVDKELRPLRDKLYDSMFREDSIISTEEILNYVSRALESCHSKYHSVNANALKRFMDKVKIFGTHFASLDIRQDHRVHHQVLSDVLMKNGHPSDVLESASEEGLMKVLFEEGLEAKSEEFEEGITRETLATIERLRDIQNTNGTRGCERYIISNSEGPEAVLFVLALFRICGYDIEQLDFHIVPLFETMDGMDTSRATMRTLFATSVYRRHLQHRGERQTIMLGFSDGTKDGGYLKANWAIQQTKERLTCCCQEEGIDVVFFDGRGGPPARGGGKTHRFYASQGPDVANHEIQLTIQGQTISSTYGTGERFKYNLEQMLTAGLSNHFAESDASMSEPSRQLLDRLAELSYESYAALKEHPLFIPYLEEMSTLKYYGKANIGSRPAKRGLERELTLSDLRAISFVGSWSQLKQNVPGYFGIGTAIKVMVDEGREEELRELFQEVPFFKALIMNSMMSLKKCYFELTSYMADHPRFGAFWKILFEEYLLSKEMCLLISGQSALMAEEFMSRRSVEIREQIVLPLLVVQQYALQKISGGSSRSQTYEKVVTRSLYGNINAGRNSA